jgi:CHAT domain-containing protein/tetratricopeptide (TPR) repeat protein
VLAEAERGLGPAIALLERALARIDAEHPTDVETALTLSSLWLAYQAAGDAHRSAVTSARLQTWMKSASPQELADLTTLQADIAEYYRTYNNLTRAEHLHRFALEMRTWLFGATSLEAASSMAYLGLTLAQLENYTEALPLYRQSLELRRARLSADDLAIAASAHNLAAALRATGKPTDAEPLYEEALRIRETRLGPEDPDVAVTLTSLGLLAWQRGDSAAAQQKLERALRIYQIKRPGQIDVALTKVNLATILLQKGNYTRARPLLKEARDWFETHRAEAGVTNIVNVLNTLAVLERVGGDMATARAYEARARRLTTSNDTSPTLQAALACNAASDQSLRGDLNGALQSYFVCLQTFRSTLNGDHNADVAYAMRGLALVYAKLEDWPRAEDFANKAAETLRSVEGRTSGTAGAIDTLATVHRASGRLDLAIAASIESAEVLDSVIGVLLGEGASRDKRAFFRTIQPNTYKLLSLNLLSAPNDPAATRLGLETLLRRKGRVLDAERDTLASARRHATPEDMATLNELRSLRNRIAVGVLGGGHGRPEAQSPDEQLTARADELERTLAQRYPGISGGKQPITVAAVQARLGASQALVEFAYFDAVPASEVEPNIHDAAWEYAAYVLPATGAPRFVRLGASAPIDALATRLHASLIAQERVDEIARELDAAVMSKVRPLLGGARDILVSPDGALNVVPFSALIDEAGSFLLENYNITYLTSGRDLLRERAPARAREVIVAVSDFGASPAGKPLGIDVFEPLPGALAEAELVSGFFPNATVLEGAAATKRSVLDLRGPRILHAATHAKFASPAEGQDPLLASTIALANANGVTAGGGRGVLTALEASSLDLWGTEMVVLSACESGRGEVFNGDGVYGLRRSLVLAGARTQVLSLWQVEDVRVQEILGAFYRGLARGSSRGEALRTAQLSVSRQRHTRHPIYWANFTLSGDSGPLGGLANRDVAEMTKSPRGCGCRVHVRRPTDGYEPFVCVVLVALLAIRRRHGVQ